MTETEWWNATEPTEAVSWLFFDRFATDRKLRLFSLSSCNFVKHWVKDDLLVQQLSLVELFADGHLSLGKLQVAQQAVQDRINERRATDGWRMRQSITSARTAILHLLSEPEDSSRDRSFYDSGETLAYVEWVVSEVQLASERHNRQTNAFMVYLLHDIFGNPFHPVAVEPAWLTSDVVALAEGIYQERAFDRMPILADTLMDAGCENEDILTHCREPGEHVRGCWVIDSLTGRK